eukprot:snap_masked-scaffold_36-processed-gene-1.29-mRNA-1 protein AED:1.00 eAED:1.00 QI:0/0/0/0/1/1/2/0/275
MEEETSEKYGCLVLVVHKCLSQIALQFNLSSVNFNLRRSFFSLSKDQINYELNVLSEVSILKDIFTLCDSSNENENNRVKLIFGSSFNLRDNLFETLEKVISKLNVQKIYLRINLEPYFDAETVDLTPVLYKLKSKYQLEIHHSGTIFNNTFYTKDRTHKIWYFMFHFFDIIHLQKLQIIAKLSVSLKDYITQMQYLKKRIPYIFFKTYKNLKEINLKIEAVGHSIEVSTLLYLGNTELLDKITSFTLSQYPWKNEFFYVLSKILKCSLKNSKLR